LAITVPVAFRPLPRVGRVVVHIACLAVAMGLAILPLATVCDFSFNRDLPEAFNESLLKAPLELLGRLVIVLFRELNGQLALAVGFVVLIYSLVAPFQVADFIGFCHSGETLTHVLNEYTVED
jgi:hypothetical protein